MKTTSGLTDSSTASEIIFTRTLKETRGWDLISANQNNSQSPGIDLADKKARIAIQVTNIADPNKIRHSQQQFEKNKLGKSFDTLYIVGTSKVSSRPKDVPEWVVPIELKKLLRISSLGHQQLKNLHQILMDEIRPHEIGRGDDRYCFDQFLSILDRPAIRDHTDIEGNYRDMLTAFKELQDIIKKGTIPGYYYTTKSSVQYSEAHYEELLDAVSSKLRTLINILNREADCTSDCFTEISVRTKDKLNINRIDIIDIVNEFCKKYQHKSRIKMDL